MTDSKLGVDPFGNTILVNQSIRRQGTYILGASGTGKSVLLHSLIMQDITQGIGVIVIDPNRDLVTNVLASLPQNKIDQTILLDIANAEYPFGLNIYECPDPTDPKAVQYTMDRIMHIWDRLFQIRRENPLMSHHLRNAAHLIIVNPGYTLADIPLIYYDETLRKKLVANVKDIYVRKFWEHYEHPVSKLDRSREMAAVINKFTEYVQPMVLPIIGQAKSTIDLRKVMDDRKIVLLQLDPQLQSTTSLVGSTLISMILMAAYSREDLPLNKRKQVNVYIDELDYFATRDVQQIFQECRKYGVSITAAHQSRVKLQLEVPELARGILGAATIAVFRVTSPDAEELAGSFDSTPPPPKMEPDGRQPILVLTERVVDELKNNGHATNSRIMELFNQWIRPLAEVKQTVMTMHHATTLDYAEELHMINRFLVNAMTGSVAVEASEQKQLLSNIILYLRDREKFSTWFLPRAFFWHLSHMPDYNVISPSEEEIKQAITDFVLSYTNGKFPQAAMQTFHETRIAHSLRKEFHQIFEDITTLRTAEEKIRIPQMQKQYEIRKEQLERIKNINQTASVYNSCYYDIEWRIKNSLDERIWKMVSHIEHGLKMFGIDPLLQGISWNEVAHLLQELRDYLAVWGTLAYQTNPKRTDEEKAGAEIYRITHQIVVYFTEKFREEMEQWTRWHYQEGTQKALQDNDPVMAYRHQNAIQDADRDVFGKEGIPHFAKDMMELACLLKANPARTESGQYEITYRPGPQQSHADRQKEIANMLTGLPQFTAYCRTGTTIQYCCYCGNKQLPSDIYCPSCGNMLKNEYMITPASLGIKQQAGPPIIDKITKQNINAGYLRKRSEVEEEIAARHQPPPAPPQPHAPKPPQNPPAQPPTPRKRALPQGKQCPSCSTQNNQTAKFCQNCGKKL